MWKKKERNMKAKYVKVWKTKQIACNKYSFLLRWNKDYTLSVSDSNLIFILINIAFIQFYTLKHT